MMSQFQQLQEELKNALVSVHENRTELMKFRNEGNQVLVDIKSEYQKLNQELMGSRVTVAPDGTSNNSMGLMENRTIRDILEEMSMQVKMLSLDRDDKGHWGGDKVGGDSVVDLKFGGGQSVGEEIRSNTDAEEQTFLSKQMDDAVGTMPKLADGMSSKGRSISSVGASIVSSYSCVVEIGNFLDGDLIQLQHTWPRGSAPVKPPVIKAGTREVMSISNPSTWINGLFSYRIEKSNLRLLLQVSQSANQLLFALAAATLPVSLRAFEFEGGQNFWGTMRDRRWITWTTSSGSREMVILNGQILARAKFTGGQKAIVQLEIVRRTENPKHDPIGGSSSEHRTRTPVLDGQTVLGRKVTRMSEYVLENYGYVVEITNLLRVPLNESLCYLENGQLPFLLPEMVSSRTREVMIVKMDYSGITRGGLATFRIGTTDLRLAIVFKLFNCGNKVGAAFIPATLPTDANMMLFLSSENQWRTSVDQKCGQSKDGGLIIQSRNILAMVSMTNGLKAVLKVVIKAV